MLTLFGDSGVSINRDRKDTDHFTNGSDDSQKSAHGTVNRRKMLRSVATVGAVGALSGVTAPGDTAENPFDASDSDSGPTTLEGRLIVGEDMSVIKGRVTIEGGTISSIEEQGVESDDIILPSFINPHTHITDSHAKEDARGFNWTELFVDPGLKSQLNSNATQDEIDNSMSRTMDLMKQGGTGAFVDFKELGLGGAENLERLDQTTPVEAYTLLTGEGLPKDINLQAEIEQADGYNAYYPYTDQDERAREICDQIGKIFALHSGEPSAEDIDASLALNPDYTSHMVQARPRDYGVLAEKEIGVAAQLRSNLVILGKLPPLELLHEYTTVALGTDNVMLNSTSMFREMEFASKNFNIPTRDILRMATINGARLLGQGEHMGSLDEGKRARMTVLSTDGGLEEVEDEVEGIVRRASIADVKRVVLQ